MENKTHTVDDLTLANLTWHTIYSWLIRYGRDYSLEHVKETFRLGDITLPEKIITDAYDFACDLYDDNKANGYLDQEYAEYVERAERT